MQDLITFDLNIAFYNAKHHPWGQLLRYRILDPGQGAKVCVTYSIVWKNIPGCLARCLGFVIVLDWSLGDYWRMFGVMFAGLLEGF